MVSTGLLGRFICGLVPVTGERHLEVTEMRSRIEQIQGSLNPVLQNLRKPQNIQGLLRVAATAVPEGAGFLRPLLTFPWT